jgi:hypothetical protein
LFGKRARSIHGRRDDLLARNASLPFRKAAKRKLLRNAARIKAEWRRSRLGSCAK